MDGQHLKDGMVRQTIHVKYLMETLAMVLFRTAVWKKKMVNKN